MQAPQIRTIDPIHLIGMEIRTDFSPGPTVAMWRSFMPRRGGIPHQTGTELYSVQVFDRVFRLEETGPQTVFRRRAAVAVTEVGEIPEGMQAFELEGGLYAVFRYRGRVADYPPFVRYMFGEWMPASPYEPDHRAHFEVLGDAYLGPDNPDSEEDIWIPIRKKG